MRNATEQDVQKMRQTLEMPFGVMFYYPPMGLVHKKKLISLSSIFLPPITTSLVEVAEGEECILVNITDLKAVPKKKKKGSEKKAKKPHVKGTHPELGYQPHRMKVGVKVKCRDGVVREVKSISDETMLELRIVGFTDGLPVFLSNGRDWKTGQKSPYDVIQILDQKTPKTPTKASQYEGGKWYRYDGNGQPVEGDVKVQVFLTEEIEKEYKEVTRDASGWDWTIENCARDILAFKIVK